MPSTPLLEIVLVLLLCLASLFDMAQRRIPNWLVAGGLLAALALHGASAGASALLTQWLGGCATGLMLFLPLYLLRAMAAGDVKLMMMVGAFCGVEPTLEISLATYIAGGLMALVIVLVRGKGRQAASNVATLLWPMFWRLCGVRLAPEPSNHTSVGTMPYALAITAGTLAVLWWRNA